ncbi:RNA polymerase sigma factor [Streptomyces sp. V4I2]|uniref:RNA polymerase sigma factor n=1 Tax=Streptomyces sp. V4I2 TaxID=3042280 RepID=UPI0027D86CDA|nr:sigma-70 family RNA polymerase sigma factor [Streptomyces sp. V4I2]
MRKTGISKTDAEDVLSVAYTETSRAWDDIVDPEGFLWDRVSKRFLDHVRKQKQRDQEFLCDPSEKIAHVPAPVDGEPEGCVGLIRLAELITQLPPDDQKVIVMDACGDSKEDQAVALSTSPGAARVRLSRAKKKLDVLVKKDAEEH